MHRRSFCRGLGALAAGSLAAAPSATRAAAPMSPARRLPVDAYPLGYQLYSVRDAMARDPADTLRRLRAMGYTHGEVYGYDADADRIYGLRPAELRASADEIGFGLTSGHYAFHELLDASEAERERRVAAYLTCAQALGSDYLVWPFLPEGRRGPETFRELGPLLNAIGRQVRAGGLRFAYHNHGYEFDDCGGEPGYALLLRDTDPGLVDLQLDFYWLMHEARAATAHSLAAEHPGRFRLWHVKDMHPATRDYTELGAGSIHYANVLPDPTAAGLRHLYLEQGGNFAVDSMTSAATSAAYYLAELAG